MNELLTQAMTVFLGFLAIMNPIANTAVFTGLVSDQSKSNQLKIARKGLLIAFIIVVVFAFLGKAIFQLFDITLPALKITGGVLIFLVGYHMLSGEPSHLHSSDTEEAADIAISPLAIPILAGPGTIASAINYAASGGFSGIIITISSFAVLCLITYLFFKFSTNILSLIGASGMKIITRLMGLILAVIGTQMLITGITDAFYIATPN